MYKFLSCTAAALALLNAGAASAQAYDQGPRPPYATGAYIGVGGGDPDCSFTIAGAHAGVTVLGINIGAGARIGVPTGCEAAPAAYAQQPPPPPPAPPPPSYGYQGGYQGGYAPPAAYYSQPVAYPAPYVYAPPPCGCQAVVYNPY